MDYYTANSMREYAATRVSEGDKAFHMAMADIIEQRCELLAIAERLVSDGLSTSLVKDARAAIEHAKGA